MPILISSGNFVSLLTPQQHTIIIRGKKVTEKIEIKKDLQRRGVLIQECEFNESVIFERINLYSGIRFKDCIFKGRQLFNSCKANTYDHEFNNEGFHLIFENCNISGLYFNGENQIERGLKIINSEVKILSINSIDVIIPQKLGQ